MVKHKRIIASTMATIVQMMFIISTGINHDSLIIIDVLLFSDIVAAREKESPVFIIL
jgi:hypothetical protein